MIAYSGTIIKKMATTNRISIVDDDQSVREALEDFIRSLGYTAATFASAEEFLMSDLVRRTSCLISDMKMRGMDGADLQDCLVKDRHAIPIVFVTATTDEWIRTRVLKAGAVGFLSKPIDEESLIECLNKALKAHGAHSAEQ
jgi:FixJ family two-component response regulator